MWPDETETENEKKIVEMTPKDHKIIAMCVYVCFEVLKDEQA